jgi:hypothetical protein
MSQTSPLATENTCLPWLVTGSKGTHVPSQLCTPPSEPTLVPQFGVSSTGLTSLFFGVFFFVEVGFEFRASYLLGRCSYYHLSHTTSLLWSLRLLSAPRLLHCSIQPPPPPDGEAGLISVGPAPNLTTKVTELRCQCRKASGLPAPPQLFLLYGSTSTCSYRCIAMPSPSRWQSPPGLNGPTVSRLMTAGR